MFEENADWDGPELDTSLSEALLSKPIATPTRTGKSRNKYRPDAVPVKKRKKHLLPHADCVKETGNTPLGKRKRTKGTKGGAKVKHIKCAVFDDFENWNEVITSHELEDPSGENLSQYISAAAAEITKENTNLNREKKKKIISDVKMKKKKKKSVQFAGTPLILDTEDDILSQSVTGGAGSALSNLNLESDSVTESTSSSLKSAKAKICQLKGKFQKRMDASQFRYINEKLYTTTGDEAAEMFAKKPELFDVYHRGFMSQVEKWEVNPVDRIIEYIRSRGEEQVVADFGCGDAKIARTIQNAVFSFDLVKCNEYVIVANSSKVPLGDKSVDIAVFCLSLMGTDFKEYIREARRVLRTKGMMCVAEVSSRIPDIEVFISSIEELGFKAVKKDLTSSYFVDVIFKKTKPRENKGKFESLTLKPCTYKKR